jgi:hypothetical protein
LDMVSLVYWVVSASGAPVVFEYSPALFMRDKEYLSGLVAGIGPRLEWPLTADESLCRFCAYRSLCDRGVGAGNLVGFSNAIDNVAVGDSFSVLGGVGEVGF